MTISELITKLEKCKQKYGDDVEISYENFIIYNTEYISEDDVF